MNTLGMGGSVGRSYGDRDRDRTFMYLTDGPRFDISMGSGYMLDKVQWAAKDNTRRGIKEWAEVLEQVMSRRITYTCYKLLVVKIAMWPEAVDELKETVHTQKQSNEFLRTLGD